MGHPPNQLPLLVAQVSDLHLFADEHQDLLGSNTWESVEVVLQRLEALNPRPHFILLTGDLAQDESEVTYQKIVERFATLNIPTYWLPGNHDDVPTMERVLNVPPIYGDKSIEQGGWRCLFLDTHVSGQVYGALQTKQLQWLDTQLSHIPPQQPVLLAMHHPPFWVGSPWLDRSGLQNTAAFFEVIDPYPQIQVVLVGHVHQEFQCVRQNVTYLSTPSTCIQFLPKSTRFALDDERPGFRLMHLYPDGRFTTVVERVRVQQHLNFAAPGY